MKKFLSLLTASIAAATALSVGTVTAFAEGTDGGYPDDFLTPLTFESVTDYAVGEGSYAFAEGNSISVIEENSRTVYSFSSEVTALDFANGVYYYACAESDKVYSLPEGEATDYKIEKSGEFSLPGTPYLYYYNMSDGTLFVFNRNTNFATPLVGLSNAKVYNGVVYAQSATSLYLIEGDSTEELAFRYTDFSVLETVETGDAAVRIRAYSEELEFVTLVGGNFMTEVEEDFSGEYFKIVETVETVSGKEGMLLYKSEGVAVITLGGKIYILNPESIANTDNLVFTFDVAKQASVSAPVCSAYSVPFVSETTEMFELAAGDHVTVEARLTSSLFAYDFYRITTDDGKTGYVPVGNIPEYDFIEDPPTVIPDPDPQTDNLIRTVILILVVILLVLGAIGYLAWIGTSGKKKSAKTPDGQIKNSGDSGNTQ